MGIDTKFDNNALVVPEYDGRVIVVQEPVLQKVLSKLRDKNTGNPEFRQGLKDTGYLLTHFVLNNLIPHEEHTVQTPLGYSTTRVPKGNFYVVEILRAGGPFADGGLQLMDCLGLERLIAVVDAKRVGESGNILDEKTGTFNLPIEITTWKVPDIPNGTNILGYDPMLATGGSLITTVDGLAKMPNFIHENGNSNFTFINLVAAPYGIEAFLSKYPHARIITAAIDREGKYKGLDKNAYIRPGLGDAGVRSH